MTDDVRVTDVACGSSHSIAWAVDNRPAFPALLQPVSFPVEQDPLGISELGGSLWALGLDDDTQVMSKESRQSSVTSFVKRGVIQPPSLTEIFLSIERDQDKLRAVRHGMQALKILFCRETVLAAIQPNDEFSDENVHAFSRSVADNGHADEFPSSDDVANQTEDLDAKKCKMLEEIAEIRAETITSVDQLGMSPLSVAKANNRLRAKSVSVPEVLDPFMQTVSKECNNLINMFRLAIPSPYCGSARLVLSQCLSLMCKKNMTVADSVADVCLSILEEIVSNSAEISSEVSNNANTLMQPVLQESDHPYRTDSHSVGVVSVPGARFLRVQFDSKCCTEPQTDLLTLMDGENNIIEQLSGKEYSDWNEEICIIGDTVKWRFSATSNAAFNRNCSKDGDYWGWCFMVFPSGTTSPACKAVAGMSLLSNPNDLLVSDRQALNQPCFEVVKEMLDNGCLAVNMVDPNLVAKLALSLASCAQLSCLGNPIALHSPSAFKV